MNKLWLPQNRSPHCIFWDLFCFASGNTW